MGWFVADRLVIKKILNLKQYSNLEFNPEFSTQFKIYLQQKTLKSRRNSRFKPEFIILPQNYNPLWLRKDKVSV